METEQRTRVASVVSQHVSQALAGPMAILILIPVLVCGVGLVIALTSWFNQRANIERLATRRFNEQAGLARWQVEQALSQGNAVLQVLREYVDRHGWDIDSLLFSEAAAGQFRGRDALAYLGISDARGNYHGIFPIEPHSSGAVAVLTERRMQPNGKSHLREYHITTGGLSLYREDPEFGYDPRTRPWYLEAARERTRIASDPYPWYDTGLVGVTVADPVLSSGGEIEGVIEVDFNLNSLSRQVEELQKMHGTQILIHSFKGEVIAQAGLRQQALSYQEGRGEIPRVEEIEDPLVREYFTSAAGAASASEDALSFDQDGERFLAVSLPIELPGRIVWRVVCLGSLDAMLRTARDNMWQGVAVAFAAMLLATVVAVLFARHIVATHLRASRAEREASIARAEARELGVYRMCRKLGEGGMGEVWIAEHRMLARPVALKLIHTAHLDAARPELRRRMLARFEREAKALARLQSPHTIQIYDYGVSESGDMFYVMELLDGVDLQDLVRRDGPQPVGRVRDVLEQAARSLAEAHDTGLVHRDIKPANIYLCRQVDRLDLVKVLDFGMVRTVADDTGDQPPEPGLTREGSFEGTPAYMAPEQMSQEQKALGPPTDLYALALVGWFLMTGKHLFQRASQMESLMAHMKDEIPPLRDAAGRPVPDAFEDLLRQCLSKRPEGRPKDMRVFIEQLTRLDLGDDGTWDEARCIAWWAQIPPPDFSLEPGEEDVPAQELHKREQIQSSQTVALDATIVN